ncbi:SDR family NAD(P)-dependent oxidoreductase [Pollutimonas thiosulfatoxidans]|uniref:3-hydroxyacyl-CoA dehydrogenase n=1 Tax=Pollutimonas thiosulfatoxidans TaxID=2028345 RepID=A0A410GDF6_9BURK|nr:SDR family oxidoreductase [Pollutimonas thiosulfatoxidans]QAA94304.1 3-hydroxyacyl-CoA dehydrogenase [Pollutimonas thiosulfatoxidans]
MSNHLPLSGRHAIVTGGSRGIGLAIAHKLAGMGAQITLMGRDASSLQQAVEQLAAGSRAGYVTGDIADPVQVEQAMGQARQRAGTIHILVNNAGQASSQRFDRVDRAHWNQMIAVNLGGTFHCMQAALPDMLQAGWGRIVNVASTAALIGYPYVSAYCAAKHGVVGLTRAVALEVAAKGVTVNAVCPGYTETDIVHDAVANITQKTGMTPEQAKARLAERNPQGRLVQPEEVAGTVGWLCDPASASINGQAIPVDGGEVMAG